MEKIRIQKYFSEAGVMSRRTAEAEIAAGRVTVNGEAAKLGDKIDPDADTVMWNGRKVRAAVGKKFISCSISPSASSQRCRTSADGNASRSLCPPSARGFSR
ncbi:MAG: hypothetical protein LUI01_01450 [Firmicutes bacterium]|nr:hypothetical protein [Bacillota bacterium]